MLINLVLLVLVSATAVFAAKLARRPLPANSAISVAADRRIRRAVLTASLVVGVVGVIPFAGLPGFLWLEVTEPLGRKACPGRAFADFQSGVSWPAAILMTPLWAASFLPAYRVARLATSRRRLVAGVAAALGVLAVAGSGLAMLFYVLGCSW